MDGSGVESTVQAHVLRHRSSILTARVLEAIHERDDETFEDTLHFDFIALGGGVAAGYWAEAITGSLSRRGRTAAIVSGDPEGLAPFERPALSKECLHPSRNGMRDFSYTNSAEFPFVCKGSDGPAHPAVWYKENSITILSCCQAVFVDLDQKYVKVRRITPNGDGQLVFGDTIKVVFGRLLIATGVRPRRIGDSALDGVSKGLQGSCFCSRHPDLSGSPLEFTCPDRFGFGSVHYVRDLGDSCKLVQAMKRVEVDGQDTCKDPVVLVGGGFITCDVAAAIATHYPGMPLVMVMPGEDVMSSTGFGKDICHFYEKQLARAGVVFAKGYRVNRLWGIEEEGSFPTLERTSQGSSLKKTLPRTFGPADPHFTDCRGVVLLKKETGEKVWLAARFVVLGIGSIPNSELFRNILALSRDGGIVTDSSLCASHPSGDIFAAGDVACAPVPLAGYEESTSSPEITKVVRFEHVNTARDMGKLAAKAMLGGIDADEQYDPVPYMYSRLLDLSWKFFGFARGETCVLGVENFPVSRTFGAFWVFKGRIVGAFLEADPRCGVDYSATLERIAREQPPVLSIKHLKKCPLEKILSDPYCLTPPKLDIGEFHADIDKSSIEEAFHTFAVANDKVKREDMSAVMKDLGADWDEDELADVLEALDPSDSGFVLLTDFVRWWSN